MSISQIAQTIHEQIGHKAYFMMGAKNIVAGEDWLSFKVGRVAKGKANYVKVIYDHGLDLYNMEFSRLWNRSIKPVATESGVYAEDMHVFIRKHTGLATNL